MPPLPHNCGLAKKEDSGKLENTQYCLIILTSPKLKPAKKIQIKILESDNCFTYLQLTKTIIKIYENIWLLIVSN